MGTATLVRKLAGTWKGDARLYRCDPPMQYRAHWGDTETKPAEFVIVSGVDHGFACETYIFPATPEGEVADWGELDGSFQGCVNHALALQGAGYSVTEVA